MSYTVSSVLIWGLPLIIGQRNPTFWNNLDGGGFRLRVFIHLKRGHYFFGVVQTRNSHSLVFKAQSGVRPILPV